MKSRLFNIRLSFEITENKSEDFFLLKNDLISLLDAIQRTGSIKAAAEELLMFPCVNYPRVFTYLNRSSTF